MSSPRPIGFIVLPPAHGKTTIHLSLPYLLEADSVYPCRGTPLLSQLRTEAKRTGEWDRYDRVWARELLRSLPPGDSPLVVMVPAQSVGVELGGAFLMAGRLLLDEWEKALTGRSYTVDKYMFGWEEAGQLGQTYSSHHTLQEEVRRVAANWVTRVTREREDALRE